MAMVAPTTVDTLAPTTGADARVICTCEEDLDDYDDIEAPILMDLVIIFKALPLLKCMHKNANSSLRKSSLKIVANLRKNSFHKKGF
jgi:hypothetical protein